jgi:hypothetical protein
MKKPKKRHRLAKPIKSSPKFFISGDYVMTQEVLRTMPHDFIEQEHIKAINSRGKETTVELLLECSSPEIALRIYIRYPKKEVCIWRKMREGSDILELDEATIKDHIERLTKGSRKNKPRPRSATSIKKQLLKQKGILKGSDLKSPEPGPFD